MIHQIEQLIARGILVVSIGGAQKLARTLELTLTHYTVDAPTLMFNVDTIDGSKLIFLRDAEEANRLLKSILDFYDQLPTNLIDQDRVKLIDLVSSNNPALVNAIAYFPTYATG